MKLLVYEYVSGGGFIDKPLPTSILSEGFGMLRTVISDFKAAGHSVTTVLDPRLATLNPPVEADCIMPVFSFRETEESLQKVSEFVDAAYVIAPESNQVLQSLVARIEKTGLPSLNCRASAIGKVSDKARFYRHMKKLGLTTPASIVVSALNDAAKIKHTISDKLAYPLIFKPVDGVGCGGLSVVRNESQVADAVDKIIRESSSKYFIVQELVHGVAVSVSLISTGNETFPISLNRQDVSLATSNAVSSYEGGLVPFDSLLRREAFAMAQRAVKALQGLRGYVGVDLILTEKEPVVIEVNPRLTTSYIGVRKVVNFNIAQAIINSVFERKLPMSNESVGYALFSKVKTPKPTIEALQKTYGMEEVVSPPFPVSDMDSAHAMVLSHRATLKEAVSGFHEAKKRLLKSIRKGM